MPKDNEVDEKAVAFAMTDDQGDAPMTIATTDRKYAESWASEGIRVDPLYSAATVAELRAKADAAERRVAALQECAVRYMKWLRVSKPEAALEHDLHDAGMCGDKALTGADPT